MHVFSGYDEITDEYYSVHEDNRPSLETIQAQREERYQAEQQRVDERIEIEKREDEAKRILDSLSVPEIPEETQNQDQQGE